MEYSLFKKAVKKEIIKKIFYYCLNTYNIKRLLENLIVSDPTRQHEEI